MQRSTRLVLLLLSLAVLSGCQLRPYELGAPPYIGVLEGDAVTFLVAANPLDCPPGPDPCIDPPALPYDYVWTGLPSGAMYSIDRSLQSVDTPGLVTMTLDASSAVEGTFETVLVVSVQGQQLATKAISVRVLPIGPSLPAGSVAKLYAANQLSLAKLEDGSYLAWGLGNAILESKQTAVPTPLTNLPAGALAVDEYHILAVEASGAVVTWGNNWHGSLGLEDLLLETYAPTNVPGLTGIEAVGAGSAMSGAIDALGQVITFGNNETGALGLGHRDSPVLPTFLPDVTDGSQLAFGSSHALLLHRDGTVSYSGVHPGLERTASFRPVVGLADIEAVAAGRDFSVALDSSGDVWGFGMNDLGQLGFSGDAEQAQPVSIAGLPVIASVDVGASHTVALAEDGSVWTWGLNTSRQLGHGRRGEVRTPQPVALEDGVVSAAAGSQHTLALLDCGKVLAWGRNNNGELGVGGVDPFGVEGRGEPQAVAGLAIGGVTCDTTIVSVSFAGSGAGDVEMGLPVECIHNDRPGAPCQLKSRNVPVGTNLTMRAQPLAGESAFTGWEGDCAGPNPELTLTVDRPTFCIATFTQFIDDGAVLTVDVPPGGRVVAVDSETLFDTAPIDCGEVCNSVYTNGANINLALTLDPGAQFNGWSGDCAGTALTTRVTMDGRRFCRADVTTGSFNVTVQVNGDGYVDSSPPGIYCETNCTVPFTAGTNLTLTATADPGSTFVRWSGGCSGTAPSTQFVVNNDINCRAEFAPASGDFTLTVTTTGTGRVVGVEPNTTEIDCGDFCTDVYPPGTRVVLMPAPESVADLVGWSGCDQVTDGQCVLTMNGERTVNAQFN